MIELFVSLSIQDGILIISKHTKVHRPSGPNKMLGSLSIIKIHIYTTRGSQVLTI